MNLHHPVVVFRNTSGLVVLTIQLLLKLINQLLASLLLLLELFGSVGRIADVNQIASLAVCRKQSKVAIRACLIVVITATLRTFGAELI